MPFGSCVRDQKGSQADTERPGRWGQPHSALCLLLDWSVCSGLWGDRHIRNGDGFICVYSITSRDSYNEVAHFRDQILQAKDVTKVRRTRRCARGQCPGGWVLMATAAQCALAGWHVCWSAVPDAGHRKQVRPR